jgi:hypothetical protein
MKNNLLVSAASVAIAILAVFSGYRFKHHQNYTVIPYQQYQAAVKHSQQTVQAILNKLPQRTNKHNLKEIILSTQQQFLNKPYNANNPEGEANWCSGDISHTTCPHIKQDPIYRNDEFDCYTYVTQILAFIGAHNLTQYNKNILSIRYGAAHQPPSNISYYNRNNFISSDYNRVNQNNGLLRNALTAAFFQPIVKSVSTTINHQAWFKQQESDNHIGTHVRVFNNTIGQQMYRRFKHSYPNQYHHFKPVTVTMSYIPKNKLFTLHKTKGNITYQKNQAVFNRIPTPSVMEIVRNDKLWKINGRKIKALLHSGITVSHMGLLYRQRFHYQQLMYREIYCQLKTQRKFCKVTPISCEKKTGCNVLMLTHATEAYPNNYLYYADSQGHYHCSATIYGKTKSTVTQCNRVVALPLAAYLSMRQYGQYRYLPTTSFVGLHIETINPASLWRKFE